MINIQPAHLNEAKEIVSLHIATWRFSYKDYIPADKIATMVISDERIATVQEKIRNQLIFIAQKENKIIGFITLANEIIDKETEIKQLYIHPDFQRQGIGQQLLKYTFQELKKRNCQTVYLWTLKEYPPSNQFYQKMGGILTHHEKKLKMGITTIEFMFDLTKIN